MIDHLKTHLQFEEKTLERGNKAPSWFQKG